MKHAVTAALALALGFGLATGAQAHGIMRHSAVQNRHLQANAQTMQHRAMRPMTSRMALRQNERIEIKQAQQTLKTEGFYNGRVDGKLDRNTRMAIAKFQKRNGLPRTAKLDRNTLDRMMGNQGAGVGSSMPPQNNRIINPGPSATQAPNAGSSTPPNTQATPAPNAGGSAPTSNQNTTNK